MGNLIQNFVEKLKQNTVTGLDDWIKVLEERNANIPPNGTTKKLLEDRINKIKEYRNSINVQNTNLSRSRATQQGSTQQQNQVTNQVQQQQQNQVTNQVQQQQQPQEEQIQQQQQQIIQQPLEQIKLNLSQWWKNPTLQYNQQVNPNQFSFVPSFSVQRTSEPSNPVNRSEIRQKMRNAGLNPYSLSGSERKMLRKAYNGEIQMSEDNPLFSIFQQIKEYKKGGILFAKKGKSFSENISNIVEKSRIKAIQSRLYDLGAFGNIPREKAVDGIMGPATQKAMERVKLLETVKEKTQVKTSDKKAKSSKQYHAEINPKDKEEFAKWLYEEGKDNLIGNMFDTGLALTKSFSGIGQSVNVGEGTKKQLIALHLFDNNNISNKDNVIKHVINKDSNGDYRWKKLNGNQSVHNGKSIFVKGGTQPGEYIAGQYTVYETPDNYHVSDTYNFNSSGTDYTKKLIDSGNGTFYDRLRYYAGTYGSNKDLSLELDIPKETVLKWYNDFKSGKGVHQRTKKIQNEYNDKGYVGSGRQSYL